ncbi:MAG: 2-hydroxyacid dehydrogenase [Anaerolineales bacterium]|jgi:glyoxylate reductase
MNPDPQNKPRVFVTRRLPEEVWAELAVHVDAELWDYDTPPPYETILEKVVGKDGLLCLLTDRIDAGVMQAGSELKVISQIAVGYDNIDVDEATRRGVKVGNTPGVLTDATADFTFTLLMAAARRVGEGIEYVKGGRWTTWGLTSLLGQEVYGVTLGIIGFGRIGQAVARRAQGFNMRVLYYDRNRKPEAERELGAEYHDLDDLLGEADFVSLHVDLNEGTHYMIGAAELDKMKPTGILVNTARGPIVDSEALYNALKENRIAGAALDVTDPEPLPAEHKLLSLPNITVLPHIASATRSTRLKMCRMALENLLAGLKGEPLPYPVN